MYLCSSIFLTVLVCHAADDQKGVAELLVDRGADVDKGCSTGGDTPLLAAAEVSSFLKHASLAD